MTKLNKQEVLALLLVTEEFMRTYQEEMRSNKSNEYQALKRAYRKLIDNFEELKANEATETLLRG